jgi:NAD-dependent oxidoreductase involved in siderophore biosynthesis
MTTPISVAGMSRTLKPLPGLPLPISGVLATVEPLPSRLTRTRVKSNERVGRRDIKPN